ITSWKRHRQPGDRPARRTPVSPRGGGLSRGGVSNRGPYGWGGAAILTALSKAGSVGRSVMPAEYLLLLSTYARTLADCAGISEPGAFDGIVISILSRRAPTVM